MLLMSTGSKVAHLNSIRTSCFYVEGGQKNACQNGLKHLLASLTSGGNKTMDFHTRNYKFHGKLRLSSVSNHTADQRC